MKGVSHCLFGIGIFCLLIPSVVLAQCYSFETTSSGIPLSWSDAKIPVHVVVNYLGTPDVPNTTYSDGEFMAVHNATTTWSQVNTSYFWVQNDGIVSQSVTGLYDTMNLIVWRNSSWSFDPTAIAVTTTRYDPGTGTIQSALMELNDANFTWKVVVPLVNCNPQVDKNAVDVQNIVTHESGHILGLGHPPTSSTCAATTMYYASGSCEISKRTLTQDDETGLSFLYPARVTISSVSPSIASNNAGVTLTIAGSGFLSGAAVTMTQENRPSITATQVTGSGPSLSAAVPLSGASVGQWTVWVTNPDGNKGKLFDGFTVAAGAGVFQPVADAGVSNTAYSGRKVVLDGSKSYDPDGLGLTYSWRTASAPENVTLTNPTTPYPSFTPQKLGSFVFTLVVNNGAYPSQDSQVTITVTNGPSSSGSSGCGGCGCTMLPGRESGGADGWIIPWLLPASCLWVRRRKSRRTPQPGYNPR